MLRRHSAIEIINVANLLEYVEKVREVVIFYHTDFNFTDFHPSASTAHVGKSFLTQLYILIGKGNMRVKTRHMKATETQAILGFKPHDFDFNLASGVLYIESIRRPYVL